MIVTKEKGVDAAFKRKIQGQVWWPTPVIPALGRLRQGDLEFETNLGFRGGVQSSVHVLGSHSFFFFFFFFPFLLNQFPFLGLQAWCIFDWLFFPYGQTEAALSHISPVASRDQRLRQSRP
jgi:hypothetical protein